MLYIVFILYFHMFNNINKVIDYLLFVGMLKKLMAKETFFKSDNYEYIDISYKQSRHLSNL